MKTVWRTNNRCGSSLLVCLWMQIWAIAFHHENFTIVSNFTPRLKALSIFLMSKQNENWFKKNNCSKENNIFYTPRLFGVSYPMHTTTRACSSIAFSFCMCIFTPNFFVFVVVSKFAPWNNAHLITWLHWNAQTISSQVDMSYCSFDKTANSFSAKQQHFFLIGVKFWPRCLG